MGMAHETGLQSMPLETAKMGQGDKDSVRPETAHEVSRGFGVQRKLATVQWGCLTSPGEKKTLSFTLCIPSAEDGQPCRAKVQETKQGGLFPLLFIAAGLMQYS